jgi:acyl-CoA synthetase (NDP forming)
MAAVAVIGASNDRAKYGNRAVRAYRRQGWTVYPVNPNEPTIEGLPAFARITDIPAAIDRASLYVPPDVGERLLAGIKAKGVKELFVNPGAESPALLAEAERLGLEPIQACSIVDIGETP